MESERLLALALVAALFTPAVLAITATAQEATPPYTITLLENQTIIKLYNTSKGILVIGSANDTTYIDLVHVNSSSPIPAASFKILARHRGTPLFTAVNSLSDPRYYAGVLRDGTVIIIDLATGGSQEFATPGTPLSATFIGDTLLVLEASPKGNVLYAFTPRELGWYEARLRIGNLLPNRRENTVPLSLTPIFSLNGGRIDYSGKAILLAETKPLNATKGATLAGVLLYRSGNNTPTPIAGAEVYVIDTLTGAIVGKTTTSKTGSFNAPLPAKFNQVTLYVKINTTCYSFIVSEKDATKLSGNIYILKNPLILSPDYPPTVCPSIRKNYGIAIIEPGPSPLLPRIVFTNVNITTRGLNILLAYQKDNILYLVARNETNSGEILEILAVNTSTMTPITSLTRYYYTASTPVSASISPDGKVVAVTMSNSLMYIIAKKLGAYELVWSLRPGEGRIYVAAKRVPNTPYYALVSSTDKGAVTIAYIDLVTLKGYISTLHEGIPYISTGFEATGVTLSGAAAVIATRNTGIAIINNICNRLMNTSLTTLDPYTVRRIKLRVIDELGRPVKKFQLHVIETSTVNGRRITLLDTEVEGFNGTAVAPIIPSALVQLVVKPLDTIHSEAKIQAKGYDVIAKPLVKVLLKPLRVVIILRDEYTGSPPVVPLTISLKYSLTNMTKVVKLPPGSNLTLTLKPGVYQLQVEDTTGHYYYPLKARIRVLPNQTTYNFTLRRIPALLKILIKAESVQKPLDRLHVTLTSPEGKVLAEVDTPPPTNPNVVREVDIATKYRGTAILTIKPVPQGMPVPYFHETRRTVTINKTMLKLVISLKPALYMLKVQLIANDTGVALPALFTVTTKGNIVAKAKGTTAEFRLERGNYTVTAEPLKPPKLPFPLYGHAAANVTLAGNVSIRLTATPVRKLTNITIRDPYSPNGRLIDTVTVILDGVKAATIGKGKPARVTLPLLVKGSNVTLASAHKIYPTKSKVLKPSSKPISILYPRRAYKATVYVVNDIGKPVGGATVTFSGIDVRYSSSTITLPDGSAEATLPYGKYRVCVNAAGYNSACTTASVTTTFKTTIVLTPKPLTIITRYMNLIAITVFAAVMIVIIRMYFKKVLEKFTTEEEF